MRQVLNPQGHLINPLRAILFFAAMLLFIFTVVYRMVKSDRFSSAMATLVEALLTVALFIFLGILLAYLLYFIPDRFRQGAKSDPVYGLFDAPVADNQSASESDSAEVELDSDEKTKSGLNS